jgi:uncharacterized protein (TIGR02444 family)
VTDTLWEFARKLWNELPLRQAMMRFQRDYQQSACLLVALCWLVANQRLPDAALLAALREQAAGWEQTLAPLRRLLQQCAAEADEQVWHQALMAAQLEGEKVLLARLQQLVMAADPPVGVSTLDEQVLRTLPEIGFCEGQTQLLAELVSAWSNRQT